MFLAYFYFAPMLLFHLLFIKDAKVLPLLFWPLPFYQTFYKPFFIACRSYNIFFLSGLSLVSVSNCVGISPIATVLSEAMVSFLLLPRPLKDVLLF